MLTKKYKTNKGVQASDIKAKGAKILPLISIIFIIAIIVGFIYAASYSMLVSGNSQNKHLNIPSLVTLCQTNQCVANITSYGY